jgi:hypothetical protein
MNDSYRGGAKSVLPVRFANTSPSARVCGSQFVNVLT